MRTIIPLLFHRREQSAKPAGDWFEELRASDCCVTLVRTVSEVAAELPDRDVAPPALGKNTREVLGRCGFSGAEIEDLERQGVVR